MKCIICYDNYVNIFNPRIKERNNLITYYKTYGITVLKKHVDANHFIIANKFEEEINNEIIGSVEKQPTNKRPNVLASAISSFFSIKEPFKKDDVQQKDFLQDLGLLIVKRNLPLQFVENVWFERSILHLSLIVVFPFIFKKITKNMT
jgi:hypothetical protein